MYFEILHFLSRFILKITSEGRIVASEGIPVLLHSFQVHLVVITSSSSLTAPVQFSRCADLGALEALRRICFIDDIRSCGVTLLY